MEKKVLCKCLDIGISITAEMGWVLDEKQAFCVYLENKLWHPHSQIGSDAFPLYLIARR